MVNQNPLPKFKIVTPSFNQGRFIRQTIDSVLSQLEPGDEYWVIDGGSTDDTVAILQSYGKRLHWVSEADRGQAHAINKGLQKVQATAKEHDIFTYINSDDYYLPRALSVVRQAFAKKTVNWLVGDARIVNEKGERIQSLIQIYKKILRHLPNALSVTNAYPQPSIFLRMSAMHKIGPFNEDLHFVMDYEYWLRVSANFKSPKFLSQVLSAFRIHGQSKGGVQYKKQFAEDLAVAKIYIKNPLVFWLHRLHNQCIVLIYGLIK